MRHKFLDDGFVEDAQRLAELGSSEQHHGWITSINPEKAVVLSVEEWVTAMKLRLGCDFLGAPTVCGACGERILDRKCCHALCCAKAESTRGHYTVRDAMVAPFLAGDSSTSLETPGLIPSAPSLRPADILTGSAHPTWQSAVDVMIKAPATVGYGVDVTEVGKQEKLQRYGPYLDELEDEGIRYQPAVFSSYGRFHTDVVVMLKMAARRAALRQLEDSESKLYNKWAQDIIAAVWKRAAAMVNSCIAQTTKRELEEQAAREAVAISAEADDFQPEVAFDSAALQSS